MAILDADRAGFLRSERSLIQTAGRAARNIDGEVIFYADTITPAIQYTIEETKRRRKVQLAYNKANNITPSTIEKVIQDLIAAESTELAQDQIIQEKTTKPNDLVSLSEQIQILEDEMNRAAKQMDFERAAVLRDQVSELKLQKLSH